MHALKRLLTILTLACVLCAIADVLVSWGDGSQATEWTWNPAQNRLTILRGDGNDYKFYVLDPNADPNGDPFGVIDNVVVFDPIDEIGDFSLLIGSPLDPNDPNSAVDPNKRGAKDWVAGNLRYDGGTSTITGIYLSRNLVGTHADENIFCDVIAGDIYVGGALAAGTGGAPALRKLEATSITGDITLGGMYGDIVAGSFDGDLTVGETWGGRTAGDVIIDDDYDGAMLFTDDQGFAGHIEIRGDFTGNITVNHAMVGDVEVFGDMVAPCRVWFKRVTT